MIFDERDVTYGVFSGHGPGGQQRNKAQKCVRATHEPTGLRTVATRERSLAQNKKAATASLREKVMAVHDRALEAAAAERRRTRPQAAFGSEYVRTYRMLQPSGVIDHGTGFETNLSVLDGRLDEIIARRLSGHLGA